MTDCLSQQKLEQIASSGEAVADPKVREHLDSCDACRRGLEEVRENLDMFGRCLAMGVDLLTPNRDGSAEAAPDEPPTTEPIPAAEEPPAGAPAIEGYRILHEIHRGGQGVVYQAVQKSTKRKVAVKVMKEGPFASRRDKARFEREVEVLAQLNHPSIVAIHDSGVAAGSFFFVMDYIPGQPLDEWMAGGVRSLKDTLRLFAKICEAVNAAHLRGIIHRDLKPANIRIDSNGAPHVLDFGLAKVAVAAEASVMTVTGQFMGSLPWASPEQAEGIPSKIDIRTDVYSLGVILYQMLTGRFPYDVIGAMRDVLDRIVKAEPIRPGTIRRQIDDEVETIVLKCLSKERERRYQSAGELARDIGHYLSGNPIEAKRDSTLYLLRKSLRRYRVPVGVGAGFVGLVTLAFLVSLTLWHQAVRARERAEVSQAAESRQRTRADEKATEAERQQKVALERESTARRYLYAAQMNLAQQAWEDADITRMLELLNSQRPEPGQDDLRAFEWYHLWRLCHSERLVLQAFSEPVRAAVFSPDGRVVAAAGGSVVRLFEASSGREVADLKGAGSEVRCLAFSPDGMLLAAGGGALGGKGELNVWEVSSGREALQFPELANPVLSVAFSPDSRTIATGSAELVLSGLSAQRPLVSGAARSDEVKVWDASTATERLTLEGETHGVASVAISPDAGTLAVAGGQGLVALWDMNSGRRKTVLPPLPGNVASVTFSPDGKTLAAGWGDWVQPGDVKLWRTSDFAEIGTLNGHRSGVTAVAFAPDGDLVATASHDRTVRLWQVSTLQIRSELRGHTDYVYCAAFAPDGQSLITSGPDATLRIWDTGRCPGERRFSIGTSRVATFEPGSTKLLLSGVPISELDLAADRMQPAARVLGGNMIFSRDGSVLVTTQSGRTLHIWHAPTGTLRHSIEAHTDVIWDLDLSPDGSTLASVSRDNTAKLWSTADGRLLRVIHPQGEDVRSVAFAPDGETLATMTWTSGSSVQIWDVPTGRVLVTLELGGSAMAFSPDGATLAAVGKGNCCVRLYDVRTWQLRSTVTGHTDLIWELMFSPDGRTFATASWDSTVRLWSTSTGQLLAKFAGEQGMYWSLSWSSDGRFLAAVRTGSENSLVVWEAAPQENADEDPEGVHLWATALERQGQAELAEQYLRGAWAAQRAKRGEQHAWSAAAMLDLGTLLTNRRESRDYPEAEDLLLRARSAFWRTVPNTHEWRWRVSCALRSLYAPDAMNDPDKLAAVEAGLGRKAGEAGLGNKAGPTTSATPDTAADPQKK